jgi:putative ABC transport system permease protein
MLLGNYLKVLSRSFERHKIIATINIAGLAIGMAAALLTILWVHHEWSFDRYHKNSDRVYRVIIQTEREGRIDRSAKTPAPCASALKREFPWIERSARFIRRDRIVTLNNRTIRSEILIADPTIFKVFTIPIIRGDKNSPLQSQKDVLISETMVRRYFPRKEPIGETITLGDKEELRISGVFRDIPDNSHFTFHLLTSLHTIPPSHHVNWGIRNYYTYILAQKGAHIDPTAAISMDFVDTYIGAQIRKQFKLAFHLQPLHDIHLHSDIRNEYQPNGSLYNLTLFLLAGCFILLIACLNYINLTTAWYAGRRQEVGLRKVLGASPRHILRQFLVESLLISIIATPAAMVLARWFLPIFNTLTGKHLFINILKNPWIFLSSIALIIVTSLISGIAPALFMLRTNPLHTLKGAPHRQSENPSSRQILVVFQFTLSITFMIIALIIALFTGHFTRWILLANILAWPAAYIFIANWFLNYPYRIPIPLTTFILSALTALLIAILTITHHTLKTARQNPAQTLRQH